MNKDRVALAIHNELIRAAQDMNYEKIHGIMALTGWRYGDHEFAPTKECLYMTVMGLVQDAVDCLRKELGNKDYGKEEKLPFIYVSTGGFNVTVLPWWEVEIVFAAESKDYSVDWRE